MHVVRILAILAALALPLKAKALHIDGNFFYFSDAFKITTPATNTFMAVDGSVNIDLDKKGQFTVGWAYISITNSSKNADGDVIAFTTSDMGPRLSWFLDKQKAWGLGVVYGLISNATYKGGELSNVKWRGTSLKADFGYTHEFVEESFFMGLRMNYYSASWIEQLVGSTDYSKITYTRGLIYPSLYFRWEM